MLPLGNLNGELSGQSLKGWKDYAVPCFPYRLLREQESLSDTLPASHQKEMSMKCWWEQSSSYGEMTDGALWPLPGREWSWVLHKGELHSTAWQKGEGKLLLHWFILPPLHHKCSRGSWYPLPLRPGSAGAGCLLPGEGIPVSVVSQLLHNLTVNFIPQDLLLDSWHKYLVSDFHGRVCLFWGVVSHEFHDGWMCC